MTYNITSIGENTTGIVTFMQGINTGLMFGWLGILLLIGLATITFLAFIFATSDGKKAILGTTSLSFLYALGLRGMELLPDLAIFVALIAWAASVAFMWKE